MICQMIALPWQLLFFFDQLTYSQYVPGGKSLLTCNDAHAIETYRLSVIFVSVAGHCLHGVRSRH